MPKKSPILPTIIALSFIGLLFISISSLNEGLLNFNDRYFFLKKQLVWTGIGLLLFQISSKINLALISKISPVLYFLSIISLIVIILPGVGVSTLGAKRWLNIGPLGIQPSEIFKCTSIIYLAKVFSKPYNNLLSLIVYLTVPFVLIILEPNLSTAVLIALITISIYYCSGSQILPLFLLILLITLASIILIFTSPYRLQRFHALTNPTDQSIPSSYHSQQIILALASGGLFGQGLANSVQKYRYIPKVSTDSILAIIAEEVGFLGVLIISYLYIILVTHLFKLASQIPERTYSLILSGIACWISFQCLINFGAIAALIPLTGVPLPFISYGGTSLIMLFLTLGLASNIETKFQTLIYSNNAK